LPLSKDVFWRITLNFAEPRDFAQFLIRKAASSASLVPFKQTCCGYTPLTCGIQCTTMNNNGYWWGLTCKTAWVLCYVKKLIVSFVLLYFSPDVGGSKKSNNFIKHRTFSLQLKIHNKLLSLPHQFWDSEFKIQTENHVCLDSK